MIKRYIDRKLLVSQMDEYVKQYDTGNRQINMRFTHMNHTAETILDLEYLLGLDAYDAGLAWAIGYLHVISRLEQVKRNIRLTDFEKYNHAEAGAALLIDYGKIRDFIPNIDEFPGEDVRAMELAIRYHNVLSLPENLTKREVLFCDLIRDADKIDIFRVIATTPYETVFNDTYENFISSDISSLELVEIFEKPDGAFS